MNAQPDPPVTGPARAGIPIRSRNQHRMNIMSKRRKADYTPDEWAEKLSKQRERRKNWKGTCKANSSPEEWAAYLEDRRRYGKEWRAKNPERVKARRREYSLTNRAKINQYKRELRARRSAARAVDTGSLIHIRTRLMNDQLYRDVMAAIPAKYHVDTREDIATEAIILMLDGTAADAVEAVKLGTRQHFRLFSKFETISLDQDLGDGFRLIDKITSDHMEAYL